MRSVSMLSLPAIYRGALGCGRATLLPGLSMKLSIWARAG